MSFRSKDPQIYDDLFDVVVAGAAGAVVHGTGAVRQDVFGFYYFTNPAAGAEVTFIYRQRQVRADKQQGTGEAIISGDRLYYIVATGLVSPNNGGGVAGTDYYFCGWAKENADASDEDVLMNFDGTRYDEAV
jgi:hypothetical protein